MATPQQLRETASQYRQTATLIYEREVREQYAEALNMLYEATRRELYARMLEGRESDMLRCIELHREETERVKANRTASANDGGVSVKDVRGRYKLFSTPYAERKEESERQRHIKRQKEIEREAAPRPGFKELPKQFTFKL